LPLTITTNQNLWLVQLAIASFQNQHSAAWNYIMAASVVAVPTLVLLFVFQRQLVESIKTSGIKRINDYGTTFNGLGMSIRNLSLLSAEQTRLISAENFDESKAEAEWRRRGQGAVPPRELGQEWKVSQSIDIPAHGMAALAEIQGPGAINTSG
jgi:hypothetical protein